MLLSTVANQLPLSFSQRRSPVEPRQVCLPGKITGDKNFVATSEGRKKKNRDWSKDVYVPRLFWSQGVIKGDSRQRWMIIRINEDLLKME